MSVDAELIARGVLKQALSDAGIGVPGGERLAISQLDRDEARAFLLSETGAWKQARVLWCSMADRDPERLRKRTAELLSGAQPVIEPEPKPKRPPPKTSLRRKRSAPMPGTKLADVLYHLKREEGLWVEDVMRSLNWTRPTVLTAISDLRLYYGIVAKRCLDGRYRAT